MNIEANKEKIDIILSNLNSNCDSNIIAKQIGAFQNEASNTGSQYSDNFINDLNDQNAEIDNSLGIDCLVKAMNLLNVGEKSIFDINNVVLDDQLNNQWISDLCEDMNNIAKGASYGSLLGPIGAPVGA